MGIGAYIGYNKSTWERNIMKKVNDVRVGRGMPPISRETLFFGQTNITKDPVVEVESEEVASQES